MIVTIPYPAVSASSSAVSPKRSSGLDEDGSARSSRLNYPRPIVSAGAKFDRFRGNARDPPWFLESWTAFRSPPVSCRVRVPPSAFVCTFLSFPLPPCLLPFFFSPSLCLVLFLATALPLFRRPTSSSLGMLMSFFRNPSAPIRGTSPARFFVSERMSRLIDEWRTYTPLLRDGTGEADVEADVADMCPRCPRRRFCRVLLYAGDTARIFDGSRRIPWGGGGVARPEKGARLPPPSDTIPHIFPSEETDIARGCATRDIAGIPSSLPVDRS